VELEAQLLQQNLLVKIKKMAGTKDAIRFLTPIYSRGDKENHAHTTPLLIIFSPFGTYVQLLVFVLSTVSSS
jgi:hypothetical protein